MCISRIRYIVFAVSGSLFLFLCLSILGKQTSLLALSEQTTVANENTVVFDIESVDIITSVWISQEVDQTGATSFGSNSSIAVDSHNYPHIAYFNTIDSYLMYAHWDGTKWITETVYAAGNVDYAVSIALDSNDHPHFSYYDDVLNYAHWNGAIWITDTVDDSAFGVGFYNSITLSDSDVPHIGYEGLNDSLVYAYWGGANWITQTVDANDDLGGNVIIKLDSNGNPHFGYRYDDTPYLKYAYWDGIQWVIDTAATDYIHAHLSFDLDSQDLPHFSYYNWRFQNLEYTHWTGSVWITATLDADGSVGGSNSLAIDQNDRPHISYHDYTTPSLKYAEWDGATWITSTVDVTNDVGHFTSLALDGLGNPHISYYDDTLGTLKYATMLTSAPVLDKQTFLPLVIK